MAVINLHAHLHAHRVGDSSPRETRYNLYRSFCEQGSAKLGVWRAALRKVLQPGMVLKAALVCGVACSHFVESAAAADLGFSPVSGQVTSDFGWRTDPITGNPRFHGGIDIAAPQGTPVYAPQAGMVIYSGAYGGYGNVVVLSHGNSLYTVYGHNSRLLVQPGEMVYRGQVISLVGSTGRSTGPHLHFEIHYKQQYLHPLTYLVYVQQTQTRLAQASTANSVPVYGLVGVSKPGVETRQTRSRQLARSSGGNRPVVQLLNGGDETNIEF